MTTPFYHVLGFSLLLLTGTGLEAQNKEENNNKKDFDEIIIRKKGDQNSKLTIEIRDNKVTVNGKPVDDFEDGNVAVILRKIPRIDRPPTPPAISRFKTSPDGDITEETDPQSWSKVQPNKALLGVTTEPDEKGAKVMEVSGNSPAEKAGLEKGDIITKVNEASVSNPAELSKIIGTYEPDDEVTVTYIRGEKTKRVTVKLGKRPPTFNRAYGFQLPEMPNLPVDPEDPEAPFPGAKSFNFRFRNKDGELFMEPETKPRIGIKAQDTEDGKGVAVIGITPSSAAEKAGIKVGDIITRFDGRAVNNADEMIEAVEQAKDKATVTVEVVREGKTKTIEIKTPKKLKTASF